MKVLTRKGLAANGSITSTSVLVYMALHDDDTLRFSGKRLDRITDWVVQRSAFINHDPGKLIACREQIIRHGLDYQLEQDFIRVLLKGLGYTGKEEYTGAREGAEAAYTLIFLALHELYGLGMQRLQRIQRRIKSYAWFIREGATHIFQYMKCLEQECGQQYKALQSYEEEYGELKIYESEEDHD